MEPSTKSPAMEVFISAVIDGDRRAIIRDNKCVSCGKSIHLASSITKAFRDDISLREYSISGLCQQCQDRVFEPDQHIRGEN